MGAKLFPCSIQRAEKKSRRGLRQDITSKDPLPSAESHLISAQDLPSVYSDLGSVMDLSIREPIALPLSPTSS